MGRHHAHDGPLSCWSSCKGALIPGPYGQCMTLIARETLVFILGHLVALGPLTFLNLNISTIWARDPWVSIQINFWGSLLPTKEVLHTCKIVTIFNSQFTLGHLVALGPLTFPNLNISTIWARDPWVSIQINFCGSLLPTKEVPHTCKIVNYF